MIVKVYLDKSINRYEIHKQWYMSYLYEYYFYVEDKDYGYGRTMYYRL